MTARSLFQAWAAPLALVSALILSGVGLGACGRPGASGAQTAQATAGAADAGYDAPPELDVVSAAADGSVSLGGKARPSSQVRLEAPAGLPIETTADGSGVWSAPLGPVSEPAVYRLSEEAGGRRVEAEGLIAVLPGRPTVAVLRAGAGAEVEGAAKDGLKLLAVDYDGGGGTVVSGRAPAASPLRVAVDGQPAIEGMAEPDGRFSLTLPKPLAPGMHRLQVVTPGGAAVEAAVPFNPPAAKGGPFEAASQPFGWRIDWMTAGGGSQTTLLLAD